MATEPGFEIARDDRPSARTPAEEAFLTGFARNYVTGRRMMCHLAHGIAGLGAVTTAAFVAWDHLRAGLDALGRLLSHGH